MRLLMLIPLLLLSPVVWAAEDCSGLKGGFGLSDTWAMAQQSCRIANALERIAEKMG